MHVLYVQMFIQTWTYAHHRSATLLQTNTYNDNNEVSLGSTALEYAVYAIPREIYLTPVSEYTESIDGLQIENYEALKGRFRPTQAALHFRTH